MKVHELINLLSLCPKNQEVKIQDCGNPIDIIKVEEEFPYSDGITVIKGYSCGT